MLRRFGLDSGYIYLKFTSLLLKELVVTDRPLCQCETMEGMNEQSDLIVLTSVPKEQKYIQFATERHDAGKLPPKRDLKNTQLPWTLSQINSPVRLFCFLKVCRIIKPCGWKTWLLLKSFRNNLLFLSS